MWLRKGEYIKIFVLVQLLDLLTTQIGVFYLGFEEMNPFFKNAGMLEMSFVKMAAIGVMVIVMRYMRGFPFWFYKLMIVLSAYAVIWNSIQLLLFMIYWFLRA